MDDPLHAHLHQYFEEVKRIADRIDRAAVADLVRCLITVRENHGRVFVLGVGGSAANASHLVNDFRKIGHLESYAPTDNVSELTAWVNDVGWESVFARWLERSRLSAQDAVVVLSVGGGDAERNISANLVHALDHAKACGAKIAGIVSRDGGYTAKMADVCVLIPVVNVENITAHAEAWQSVIWHAIVLHPDFRRIEGTWESRHKA